MMGIHAAEMVALAGQIWGPPNKKLSTLHETRFGAKGSKAIVLAEDKWFDHETKTGGRYPSLYKLVNGEFPSANGHDRTPSFRILDGMQRELGLPVAWWDYHDAHGTTIARVVRFEPPGVDKTFRQCRPDGIGWKWAMGGLQIPLYHLPDLLRAPEGATVFIVEGEPHADALRAWGLIATTNAGGAKKFRADHAKVLAGFNCIVLPDNDLAGFEHEGVVVRSLREAGCKSVRSLNLPNLPPKGDVLDWICGGGTAAEFEALIAKSPTDSQQNEPYDDQGQADAEWLRKRTSVRTLLGRVLPPEECLLGSLVTRTSRVFLVGPTGVGKTMFGLAMAGGMASGQGFLHLRSCRSIRVLYIDGEMPLRALQSRVRDMARRLGGEEALALLHYVSWQDAAELGMGEWHPLNTDLGQAFVLALCKALQPDVVIFDNVQSVLTGDMKDEVPWNDTWPLVAALTKANIGQIWFDHTGHDTTRQYGTSVKAWRFDTVGIMTALPKEERVRGETAFTLSFEPPGKSRNRAPDNWDDYTTCTIRLREDVWSGETTDGPVGKPVVVPPSRLLFYEALTAAISRAATAPGETTLKDWEAECQRCGHIDRTGSGGKADFRRAKSELMAARYIAIDDERVIDLKGRWE